MPQYRIVQPEGTELTDETFTGEIYGTYNVTLLRKMTIAGVVVPSKVLIDMNPTWVRTSEELDTNPERVKQMTQDEVDKNPIMLVMNAPQQAFVIDGSHRLKWIVEQKKPDFRALIYSWDDAQKVRIRFYKLTPPASDWVEIDNKTMMMIDWGVYPQHSK